MIFVTVGTQLPFDRLIRTVDEIAPSFPGVSFIAQTYQSRYEAKHIETLPFVSPLQFSEYIKTAELVISHAGIGTITKVAEKGKPLILFPRMGKLKEHRNDHQLDTCRMMQSAYGLNVAHDKEELEGFLQAYFQNRLQPTAKIEPRASGTLIRSLKDYIDAIPPAG
ncbi:MAG TPA: glycosyltransferase [Chitinophagaceae bacterium]